MSPRRAGRGFGGGSVIFGGGIRGVSTPHPTLDPLRGSSPQGERVFSCWGCAGGALRAQGGLAGAGGAHAAVAGAAQEPAGEEAVLDVERERVGAVEEEVRGGRGFGVGEGEGQVEIGDGQGEGPGVAAAQRGEEGGQEGEEEGPEGLVVGRKMGVGVRSPLLRVEAQGVVGLGRGCGRSSHLPEFSHIVHRWTRKNSGWR